MRKDRGILFGEYNGTVRIADGTTPTIFFVNDGMTYPVAGKSCASCGIGSDAVAVEDSTWLVSVPTHICGVVASRIPCGTEGAIYICAASESTMSVS